MLLVLAFAGLTADAPRADADPPAPAIDWSGDHAESIFFVLGMLDEHGGRREAEGSDIVERFSAGEALEALVFQAYLERVVREQRLNAAVRVERDDMNLTIHSAELAHLIDSFYDFRSMGTVSATPDGPKRPFVVGSLKPDTFDDLNREAKISYLAGVHARYGRGSGYNLERTPAQGELVAQLLGDVGCTNIENAPRSSTRINTVTFEAPDDLKDVLTRLPPWTLVWADSVAGLAGAEEVAGYRDVIRRAQAGYFGKCIMRTPCVISRVALLEKPLPPIPWTEPWIVRTLASADSLPATSVSLAPLACDSIHVVNRGMDATYDRQFVALSPFVLDPEGNNAITFCTYYSRDEGCGQSLAVYWKKRGDRWVIDDYVVRGP